MTGKLRSLIASACCLVGLAGVPASAISREVFGNFDDAPRGASSGYDRVAISVDDKRPELPPAVAAAAPAGIPLIDELSTLSPVMRVERLQELVELSPAARNVASALAMPEAIRKNREQLESNLGPERLKALTHFVVDLHIEAHSDERVKKAIESLSRQVAPGGLIAPFDLSRWFDGGQKPASERQETIAPKSPEPITSARLALAETWPVEEGAVYEQRVHTITLQNGRTSIDGKQARVFQSERVEGGAVKETFVHPANGSLLVKIYRSPTLESFERKTARIEQLRPLAASGAAPKLVEHGEAAVDGLGRVYFYVQEFVQGVPLKDLAPDKRPLDKVSRLFNRLSQAGLAVSVPGANQDWLMSHIMIGAANEEEETAYLVGASAERVDPVKAAAHNEMLLSVLRPGDVEPAAPAPPASAAAPAGEGKLVIRETDAEPRMKTRVFITWASAEAQRRAEQSGEYKKLGVVHGSSLGDGEEYWHFSDSYDAGRAVDWLLDQPDVRRISAPAALKSLFEPRPALTLRKMLDLIPESAERDALLLKIPGATYAGLDSADVVLLLEAASRDKASEVYGKAPNEVWKKMSRDDVERFIKRQLSANARDAAETILWRWMDAHSTHFTEDYSLDGDGSGGEARKTLYDLLRLFPSSINRDVWIARYAGTKFTGGDVAQILGMLATLISPEGQQDAGKKVFSYFDRDAWERLTNYEFEWLKKEMGKVGDGSISQTIWSAHRDATQPEISGPWERYR